MPSYGPAMLKRSREAPESAHRNQKNLREMSEMPSITATFGADRIDLGADGGGELLDTATSKPQPSALFDARGQRRTQLRVSGCDAYAPRYRTLLRRWRCQPTLQLMARVGARCCSLDGERPEQFQLLGPLSLVAAHCHQFFLAAAFFAGFFALPSGIGLRSATISSLRSLFGVWM